MKKILLWVLVMYSTIVNARDVELSWENALAFVPGALLPTTPNKLSLDSKHPVLIYMHGCSGITYNHDTQWAREIAGIGFVVIVPDSFSRPGRISDCDITLKRRVNTFPKAHQYRQEEITYAIEQIRGSAWADQKNIFLMGHSEGGQATARSKHDVWKAQIISGWTCTFLGKPELSGIHSPSHIPVLAVAFLNDEWRQIAGVTMGRCADQAGDRKIEQLDMVGDGHATYQEEAARTAVLRFLKAHLH